MPDPPQEKEKEERKKQKKEDEDEKTKGKDEGTGPPGGPLNGKEIMVLWQHLQLGPAISLSSHPRHHMAAAPVTSY